MKKIITLVCITLLLFCPVYASQLDDLTAQAENGSVEAQVKLARIYVNGLGTKIDNKKAFKWYSRAAEQGSPQAQTGLGWLYENGRGG